MNKFKDKFQHLNKKSKKTLILLLLLLLLFITGMVVVAVVVFPILSGNAPNTQKKAIVSNGNAIQGTYVQKSQSEILADLKKKQLAVTDRVGSQISFVNGNKGTEGTWIVENPISNKVTMQCEINLNGKTIATSAPISPGQHIESITLSNKINPGAYNITANINYFSKDAKTYLGKATYQIKMVIS